MKGREVGEPAERRDDLLVEPNRVGEVLAAVDDAVSDRVGRPRGTTASLTGSGGSGLVDVR